MIIVRALTALAFVAILSPTVASACELPPDGEIFFVDNSETPACLEISGGSPLEGGQRPVLVIENNCEEAATIDCIVENSTEPCDEPIEVAPGATDNYDIDHDFKTNGRRVSFEVGEQSGQAVFEVTDSGDGGCNGLCSQVQTQHREPGAPWWVMGLFLAAVGVVVGRKGR